VKKIKLLCEIDYFCKVTLEPNERTGVFNTIKFILKEISQRDDVDLTLCSHQYPISFFEKRFLKIYPEFKGIKNFWLGSFRDKAKYFNQAKAYEYRQKYKKDKKLSNKILYVLFKLFRGLSKVVPNFKDKRISQFDYYLSLSKPIPNIVNAHKKVKKAIFIHDLIPIKFPEFFEIKNKKSKQKTLNKFSEIFNSIKKETLIICNSEYTKKDLLEVYPKFQDNKIIVAYCGVDKNKFFYTKNKNIKTLDKYKIPNAAPYFLSLTSMNPRKNTAFIIESFAKFLQQNPKTKINLVLAGKFDWNTDAIFQQIEKNFEFKNRIIITGFIDEKDVNDIYNNAYAFVYPSLYEGFGLPVLEAMQCGLPIITSNTTSLPEVAGDAGILIDPTNKEKLVKAFEKLYKDKKFRKTLIEKALNRAKRFDWSDTADKIIKSF
jgi:glycosyltransferase involved in cell wall biosynthesis